MAKRIIKYGKYNVIICADCGCEFAFDSTDVEANGNVICPQCGKENTPTVKSKQDLSLKMRQQLSRLEYTPDKREVSGSSPLYRTRQVPFNASNKE